MVILFAFMFTMSCFPFYPVYFSIAVSALNCYECNVWKAGYGYPCYQPRNKTNCITCMKIETTIFMGFYKNTPRSKWRTFTFYFTQ